VNPNAISGTGKVSLTVNTTPTHPLAIMRKGGQNWLAAGGGASLAGVFLFAFPRRRWRGRAIVAMAFLAIMFTSIGCGGVAKIDPGTSKGTYIVVVTGTAGSGISQYQTSVNVPITVQ